MLSGRRVCRIKLEAVVNVDEPSMIVVFRKYQSTRLIIKKGKYRSMGDWNK